MEKDKLEELRQLFFEIPPLFQKIKLSYKSSAHPPSEFNKNQLVAIMLIGKAGEIMPSALSAHMAMEKGSMTTLIDSLVEKGLVSRSLVPGDRRKTMISLTEAGRERMNRIMEHHQKSMESMLTKLTDEEIGELHQSLKTIVKTLHTLTQR